MFKQAKGTLVLFAAATAVVGGLVAAAIAAPPMSAHTNTPANTS